MYYQRYTGTFCYDKKISSSGRHNNHKCEYFKHNFKIHKAKFDNKREIEKYKIIVGDLTLHLINGKNI